MKSRHAKVIIIGSGPAGYTAGIYAARAMLKPLLIEGIQPGGQMTITTDVENYPGFADVIQGPWLMDQMRAQAVHVGTEIIADHIDAVDLKRQPFWLKGDSGTEYTADSVIIATGAQARWLGLPSEKPFQGLRRLGLRHLRRLLLPRQERDRGRRRQHRGRGGALSRQYREPGHARASPRRVPRREDPAGAPVRQSEDRRDVEHRARRGARHRRAARRHRRAAQEHADRRDLAIPIDGIFIAIGHDAADASCSRTRSR